MLEDETREIRHAASTVLADFQVTLADRHDLPSLPIKQRLEEEEKYHPETTNRTGDTTTTTTMLLTSASQPDGVDRDQMGYALDRSTIAETLLSRCLDPPMLTTRRGHGNVRVNAHSPPTEVWMSTSSTQTNNLMTKPTSSRSTDTTTRSWDVHVLALEWLLLFLRADPRSLDGCFTGLVRLYLQSTARGEECASLIQAAHKTKPYLQQRLPLLADPIKGRLVRDLTQFMGSGATPSAAIAALEILDGCVALAQQRATRARVRTETDKKTNGKREGTTGGDVGMVSAKTDDVAVHTGLSPSSTSAYPQWFEANHVVEQLLERVLVGPAGVEGNGDGRTTGGALPTTGTASVPSTSSRSRYDPFGPTTTMAAATNTNLAHNLTTTSHPRADREVFERCLRLACAIAVSEPYFMTLLETLLRLLATPMGRRRLRWSGTWVLGSLILALGPVRTLVRLSSLLVEHPDRSFAALMVQALNYILLTAPEAKVVRSLLRQSRRKGEQKAVGIKVVMGDSEDRPGTLVGRQLFVDLYAGWSRSLGATLALCFLAEEYELAYAIIMSFEDGEIPVQVRRDGVGEEPS
jgi:hypothetical protein